MIDELTALENSLFLYKNCKDSDYLDRILHEDFMEFGTSGKIYHKKETIDLLMSVTEDRPIVIHYPKVRLLPGGQWLLHYISENKETGSYSNRTSIWIKDDNIKLYFHQGTPAQKAAAY